MFQPLRDVLVGVDSGEDVLHLEAGFSSFFAGSLIVVEEGNGFDGVADEAKLVGHVVKSFQSFARGLRGKDAFEPLTK